MGTSAKILNFGQIMSSSKQWVKSSNTPAAKFIYLKAKQSRQIALPDWKIVFGLLLSIHKLIMGVSSWVMRVMYWTPLFKSQIINSSKNLYLYGGLPFVSGPLQILVGDNSRISGQTTFSGRTVSKEQPLLEIGNNVEVGWQTTIAVGRKVKLGDNVLIAGRAVLAGYPGHPLNASERAAGLPENDNQVGDIILEDDVWLATNVSVMAGVTIGKGTIVAAGSVVTKDLPAGVLAAGVPAKVIRKLEVT